mmetsp:Transcript_28296/g.49761  ORF Transcript_28296/g.49761 Transcript_28296/m.49761 type:complete len:249 (-) Transcript_28296:207-953(-)
MRLVVLLLLLLLRLMSRHRICYSFGVCKFIFLHCSTGIGSTGSSIGSRSSIAIGSGSDSSSSITLFQVFLYLLFRAVILFWVVFGCRILAFGTTRISRVSAIDYVAGPHLDEMLLRCVALFDTGLAEVVVPALPTADSRRRVRDALPATIARVLWLGRRALVFVGLVLFVLDVAIEQELVVPIDRKVVVFEVWEGAFVAFVAVVWSAVPAKFFPQMCDNGVTVAEQLVVETPPYSVGPNPWLHTVSID